MLGGANRMPNSDRKFRRRSTSIAQDINSAGSSAETLQLDFDTRRDMRLDILHQEHREQAAEEGQYQNSNDRRQSTVLSPTSAQPRPSLSMGAKGGSDWITDRFLRRGKRQIGVLESLKAIATSSWLNLFFIFIPISWAFHFTIAEHHNQEGHEEAWRSSATFALCLMALVPLERALEYGGDQMSLYCGKELGDLIIVTLNNTVEATLAIILLVNCELRLLQSTIIGVILLHLLLVPGIAFIIGGAKLIYQSLNPHSAQLNHSLLLMGVLTLLLPTALFTTIQNNALFPNNPESASTSLDIDSTRSTILKISHGFAIILLVVYVYSRVFLYDPPGSNNAFRALPDAPTALLEEERKMLHEEPEVNQYVCIAYLLAIIALMAPTAQWLVDSVEIVRSDSHIAQEWFGLILLPLSSFAADAILAIGKFIRTTARFFLGWKAPPARVAKARSIDVSIQFNLFWLPLIILLGWWTERPFTLLFDIFEVSILIGACFLVNFVTADAKTNWAEGATMVIFYVMIALTAWFYQGNKSVNELLNAGKCLGEIDTT
ncbi:hypothetical protein GYMLUDRAFT_48978 [Collybiopsis luxurians FD-317 M1]|uniref:Sodium/calcium exchanger membrane region domain-containing protein n=1 Tax=Collybiopsis luxurians FD-317 M1 TaxID=944289 RepID=A0A0D0BHC8_9AGAR|nr:hypothetical protein GYMLUDRAFT_48978 [Collybiopsis luxurians FD-317 M1]